MSEHDDLLRRLRRLGTTPIEPERRAADLAAMASAAPGGPTTPAARRAPLWRSKVRLAAAFLAGLLVGSTGLAAADALPDPAQHIAHRALSTVGVSVPDPVRYHGPECGPDEKGNHGAYVRDDHSLARSECGKPVHAPGTDGETSGEPSGKADKGQGKGHAADPEGCHGKPPWAGNNAMTPDQRAAAQAERAARCGTSTDEAEADEDKAVPDTAPAPETSTTEGSTTTTAEASTTVPGTATTTTLPSTSSTTG